MCLIFIFKKRNKKTNLKTGQRDLAVWMAFKFYNFFAKSITESREKRGIFDAGMGQFCRTICIQISPEMQGICNLS